MKKISLPLFVFCATIIVANCSGNTNDFGDLSRIFPSPESNAKTAVGDLSGSYPADDSQSMLQVEFNNLAPPLSAPDPLPGMASVSGLLYTPSNSLVLSNIDFYFSPATGDNHDQVPELLISGGLSSRGDIIGRTDENGEFTINNLPLGNYYFIVSFPNNILIAITSPDDYTPKLFELAYDQPYPLGVIISPSN